MFKELTLLKSFLEFPTRELSVREFARHARIQPATASVYLKRFKKEGILKYRKERVYDLYKANLESDAYLDIKVYYSIRKIRKSGVLDSLDEQYLKPTVVLFGSTAFGVDVEGSDLDLLVVSESTKEFELLHKYQKIFGKNLHIFAVREVKDLRNVHLINSIANGIVLQGEFRWISKSAKGKELSGIRGKTHS